ncbi:MAG: GAF domain-containing protein [Reichenbachiella sp.]|uniref:GAF domain-containing protein n=1 Tax=Reichenbachiella sp. TaxID=2184521 RepID=UPI003265BD8B
MMEAKLEQCDMGASFPFESKLSLTNLIGYWQVRTNDKNFFLASTAKEIMKRLEKAPELLEPIDDMTVLDRHKEVVNLLMTAIFSPFTEEEEMVSAMAPFKKEDVHSTKAYRDLMAEAGSYEALLDPEEMAQIMLHKTMAAYFAIMQMYYGLTIELDKDIIYTLTNNRTGLRRYFKITINPKFCEIKLKGDLPDLSEEGIKHLTDNVDNVDVWMEMLPTEIFEFQGLIVFKLNEVTKEQVLSRMKENLLEKDSITDEASFLDLEQKFRSLLQLSDVRLGISGYQKSKNRFINFGGQSGRSILIGQGDKIDCVNANAHLYERFANQAEPMIVEDMSQCCSQLQEQASTLQHGGVNNLILNPLFYNDEFVGLLELASPNKGDLNALTLTRIKEVLPLFSIAVKRSSEEIENNIQNLIKQKYTSIHPTVEWKFNNAAHEMLDQISQNKNAVAPNIVFNNVFPLYAASDIRNSSVERHHCIYKDLNRQLQLAKKVLNKAMELTNLPILDETIFRLDAFRKKIKNKLVTGDETVILEFIQEEVEPIIRNIEANHADNSEFSAEYWNALDTEIGVVYEHRKNFEDSLTMLNDTIGTILDEEEKKAQKMFPHYFEKYKTDGVEHNIYIGASMVEHLEFDEVYLRNLRLWQLVVTAEIANRSAALIPSLPMPLETTHLILVHSNPLSIRFRQEEKKFDVDGAYNIRYEITKKRIDKAVVKDSEERITQPGKIAIIYSQDRDAEEYRRYIDYLKNKGLLIGEVEQLELEELQGVSGLRALRIAVNMESSSIIDEVKKLLEVA